MAEFFAGGHLRFVEGCWRNDDGDEVEIVEVRHGKWVPTTTPSYFGGLIYQCSRCGAKDGEHSSILGSYCWRCGAKMKEVGNSV